MHCINFLALELYFYKILFTKYDLKLKQEWVFKYVPGVKNVPKQCFFMFCSWYCYCNLKPWKGFPPGDGYDITSPSPKRFARFYNGFVVFTLCSAAVNQTFLVGISWNMIRNVIRFSVIVIVFLQPDQHLVDLSSQFVIVSGVRQVKSFRKRS